MLRPATPLTVLLAIAFILLLLSVLSTPIVKAIPLASFKNVDFGVFGYCKKGTDGGCTGIKVGYTIDAKTLFGEDSDSDFSLPSGARSSLFSILIVHPVAGLLALICTILAAASHLHSPSHSPRYLLALLILLIPTLLVTLLAFLVDILLFVPHVQWGGWIVLVSTILIVASGVVTCAMRRTLVSRKARKKRIAENAEMNGENFYSRQNTIQTGARAESPPPLNSSAPPMVNGAPGSDRLPTFTTYEKSAAVIEEDRVPLNTRTPSNKTLPNTSAQARPSKDGSEKYGGLPRGGPRGMRGGRGGFSGPRDEFGNPLPPSNAFGPNRGQMRRDPSDPRLRRQYSDENISAQGFRERGRGGYPGRGYGRGAPYGPGRPVMNGGHRGMQMRPLPAVAGGGMVANNMRNRGQEPPPDYGNGYPPNGIDRLGQYESDMPQQGPSGYGRSQSATGFGRRSPGSSSAPYGRQYSPAPASAPGGYGRQPSPGIPSAPDVYARQRSNSSPKAHGYVERQLSPDFYQAQRFRQESPPPPMPEIPANDSVIGQAVEMDARTGSPARAPHFAKPLQLRDSDSDVQGLVGLQQQREHRESPMSLTSVYSSQESYVPPRSGWGNNTTRTTTAPSNNLAPVQDSPVELPTHTSQSPPSQPNIRSPSHARYNSAENYYEDVDPRFAEPTLDHNNHSNAPLPSALTAGRQPGTNGFQPLPQPEGGNHHLQPNVSYESVEDAGKQSPAVSDGSNYTSISQRGINPQWNPLQAQGQGMSMGGIPNRRPVVQQRDLLLSSNPDFELPIQGPGRGERMGVGRGERRAPGMAAGTDHGGPTSTYPGGAF